MADSRPNLEEQTIAAVSALLRVIADSPTSGRATPHPVHGTNASFAAAALRDMMECKPLELVVQRAINSSAEQDALVRARVRARPRH